MRNMRETRKSLGITQDQLSDATGIPQSNLSAIENGKYNPHKATREKIEAVLGKVDWIENKTIKLRKTSFFKAEKLLKTIIELSLLMEQNEKEEFKQLIFKYFK